MSIKNPRDTRVQRADAGLPMIRMTKCVFAPLIGSV
jgi:hypothetical protein